MAAKYFNHMLADLERARKSMDMMTIKVPNFAARLDDSMCPTEEMLREASTQRTYHSRESPGSSFETAFQLKFLEIPAIIRKLPETSPNHDHVTLPELAKALSNLALAESSSPLPSGGSVNVLVT